MYADDVREEGGDEHEDKCDSHHQCRRLSAFQAARTTGKPAECHADRDEQEECVANRGEQNPKSGQPAIGVDKGDRQRKQYPSDDLNTRQRSQLGKTGE